MNCEQCGQPIKPIWEELNMGKDERIAYELGCSRGSRRTDSSIAFWIVTLIGSMLIFFYLTGDNF